MRKLLLLGALLFGLSSSFAQGEENKWVLNFSGSLVYFGDDGTKRVGEAYNSQVAKISATRYLFKGISADAGFTLSPIDKVEGFISNSFNYMSFDWGLRYDFNMTKENLVPYMGVGGSWINGPSTIPGSKWSPTLNFTFGGTFWFAHHWGLNAQATYKYSSDDISSMVSHSQFSAGVVYSFSARQLLYRVWER